MKEIRIKIDGKMNELRLPTSYGELSTAQYMAIMSDKPLAMWREFGLKPSLIGRMSAAQLIALQHAMNFFDEIDPECNKFLVPSIKLSCFTRLYAPNYMLAGCSLQQFMAIDSYYSYYLTTKKEEFLSQMMAAIYLRKSEGFVVDTEHSSLPPLDKRTLFFGRCSKELRMAVLLNWVMIKNWLSGLFPNMFPKSASGDGKGKAADWLALFDSFVGDNVPYMEHYQRMECMDAFRIINRKIAEQKKNTRGNG